MCELQGLLHTPLLFWTQSHSKYTLTSYVGILIDKMYALKYHRTLISINEMDYILNYVI